MRTNEYAGYHLIYEPPAPPKNKIITEILYVRIVLELIGANAIAGMFYAYVKDKGNNK